MKRNLKFIITLMLTLLLSFTASFGVLANDSGEGYSEGEYGFTSEEEAPPAPNVPQYPFPITFIKLDQENKNQIVLSLKLAEKADLTILYGAKNKKQEKIKSFNKKNSDEFENINIPLENNDNFINIKISNDSFDFATTIEVIDGEIKNNLGINSEYVFTDKSGFSILADNFETEPNNSYNSSGVKMTYSGDNNYGSFSSSDSEDWWKFTLDYKAFVNLFLGSIPSGSDYDIYLYKSTDLSNYIWRGFNSGNADEVKLYQDLEPGTYYIKVYAFSAPNPNYNYFMKWRISKHWPVLWTTTVNQSFSTSHLGLDINYTSFTKQSDTGCQNSPTYDKPCYSANAIAATWDGTVSYVNTDPYNSTGYGRVIYINHNVDGKLIQTRYAHLWSISISNGQSIKAGQQIGIMGNTGTVFGTTGTHLHYETRNCVSTGCTNSNSSSTAADPKTHFPGYTF